MMAVRSRGYLANSMTVDERQSIYRWAGEGYTLREICKMFNNQRGPQSRVRIPTIERILALPEAHASVARYQLEFLQTLKDLPISEKKVRLNDLEKLRQRLMYIINNCHLERGKDQVGRFLSVAKRLIEVLDIARNELEPRPGVAIGIGLNQGEMGGLTDEQLRNDRDDLLRQVRNSLKRESSEVDEDPEGDETPASG